MKLRKQNGFVTPPELAESSKINTLFVDGQSSEKDALEGTDALLNADILGISANLLSKGHSKRIMALLSSVHLSKDNIEEVIDPEEIIDPEEVTDTPVINLSGDNPLSIKYGRPYVEYGASASGVYDGSSISIMIAPTTLPGTDTLDGTAVAYSIAETTAYRGIMWLAAVPAMSMDAGTDTLAAGGTFVDAGVTMIAGNDDLTVVTTSDVDDSIAGSYTVIYAATSTIGVIVQTLTRNVTIT